jgi:hypothetical protein
MFSQKDKTVLATIAAHGILNHNTAVDLPDSFSEKEILRISDIGFGELPYCLDRLEDSGYLSSRDTGYYGYGDQYVPGVKTWKITAKGLMALWGVV